MHTICPRKQGKDIRYVGMFAGVEDVASGSKIVAPHKTRIT